jgi:hypothetical protein
VSATDIDAAICNFPPHVAARVAYFEEKLKQFALNLADPASQSKVNFALAQEPFGAFVEYYRRNPKLAKYSVKQDLQRLDYRVTPHGPGSVPKCNSLLLSSGWVCIWLPAKHGIPACAPPLRGS